MKTERVIAFRCPLCATAVVGDLNLFVLGGKELSLSCKDCGEDAAHLTASLSADGKVSLDIPCLVCPNPHKFCVDAKVLFSRDLFTLQCPLTGLDLCFIGTEKAVEEALEKNREELLALSEAEDALSEDEDDDEEELSDEERAKLEREYQEHPPLFDPILTGEMLYLIREFAADGKIGCSCGETHVDFRLLPDGFLFTCPKCGAAKVFPACTESDRARLEELTEIRLEAMEGGKSEQ